MENDSSSQSSHNSLSKLLVGFVCGLLFYFLSTGPFVFLIEK